MLDIERLLGELTVAEKASLTSGSSFWYTAPVERLGIAKIMVSDGPHGLRAQPGEGAHRLRRGPVGDLTGRALLEREIEQGQPAAVLQDELIEVIGTMPMSTLANFGGMSLDHEALDRISTDWRRQTASA